jgi:hypothetical protein
MLRQFRSGLPHQIYTLQVPGTLHDLGFSSRENAISTIETVAGRFFSDPFGYVFVDRGTFSKRLSFRDPISGEGWIHGDTSESVVFYCFAKHNDKVRQALLHEINAALEVALLGNNNVRYRSRAASN